MTRWRSRSIWLLMPLLLAPGCALWDGTLRIRRPEITEADVAARVVVSGHVEVNPAESVVEPGAAGGQSALAPVRHGLEPEPTRFTLPDAIAFALKKSPRLRSIRAAIERARGQAQAAFAPYLPQVDLLGQYGIVSDTLAPGKPGNEGFLLASGAATRRYAQTELGLEWILYDFGRTGGRYHQAVARESIAQLQAVRADQTVELDVATAYLDVLLARALDRVQTDAVRRSEAFLADTVARRAGGVALHEDELRAQVQLSESREALVLARQAEFDALARLNNVMGRNAAWPLEVVDVEVQPPLRESLADFLERAAAERPETGLVRQQVTAAAEGLQAAQAEFLPRISVRAALGRTDGDNVITGWQEGAGLHVEAPLYAGGRHTGERHAAEADVEAALAEAQALLDGISLQVNLAYRGVVAASELIELSRTSVVQAQENLRLVRVRYRNGDATPTDIVDGEAAFTRSQQRFFSATYNYLAALTRLDNAVGERQRGFPAKGGSAVSEVLPRAQP